MKISGIFYILIILFITGCSTSPKEVSFTISNQSSDGVVVVYSELGSTDTIQVLIPTTEAEVLLQTQSNNGNTNWYYDYKLQIHSIYNQLGDSIDFNPNISQHWVLYVGDPNYYYQLNLTDTVF